MLQFTEVLEGHKFVIWFRRPRVYLDRVFQGDNQKLNPFIFYDTEMNRTLKFANIYPTVPSLGLLQF